MNCSPVLREDLAARHDLEGSLNQAVGARIAVMDRVAEQLVGAAEQSKVHAPGIDANAGKLSPGGRRGAEPVANMAPLCREVPIQVSSHRHGTIVEAIDFSQLELLAIEVTRHMAAAGGPHVNCQVGAIGHDVSREMI